MPTYTPKQLGYDLFTRSHRPSRFEDFDSNNSFLCWIDILGVQSMNHQQIVTAVKRALLSASECSATGAIRQVGTNFNLFEGSPNTALQFSLVGDAIILAEKDQPDTQAAATLGLVYRASLLSRFLNEEGYPHKGVITRGPVHCEKFDDTSVITGKGVVNAFQLEKTLKSAGLFYDEHVAGFIQQRAPQIEQHSYYAPLSSVPNWTAQQHAHGLTGVIFSQYFGWESWNRAMSQGVQTEPKIVNALSLIGELKNVHGLP